MRQRKSKTHANARSSSRRRRRSRIHEREMKIFTGGAHPSLGRSIARFLGVPLGRAHLSRFGDGEVWFQIQDNVRGADVFVVQPTCPPVNENLMELLVMLDAFKRASAARITAVVPYYGYGRQDRKDRPRVPISAKLVADLLSTAGTDRVLTMDLHAAQIQGFFNVPVDHLFAAPVVVEYVKKLKLPRLTVVSPDAGGVERARAYAKRLDATLAIVDKRRDRPNEAEVHHVIGDVRNRTALIVDDLVDTAGTLVKVTEALHKAGARSVMGSASHAVLSGRAVQLIEQCSLSKLLITDSIPLSAEKRSRKIVALPIAELLAKAVRNIHEEASVTCLFV
ncbi:MAG: ribose-phosphate pyrophosphokinase [Vicinamibacteria bacterium]|nr:ribose-phosphate pyrophosphokinase [Vicinamibacteria bacterium]